MSKSYFTLAYPHDEQRYACCSALRPYWVQPSARVTKTLKRLFSNHTGFDGVVTGQLADTPTRGLPTRGLDDSRTGHLTDWSTRGLDNSWTGQVADWTTRGCHQRLCVLSFPFWQHLRDRELSSPRLVHSVS